MGCTTCQSQNKIIEVPKKSMAEVAEILDTPKKNQGSKIKDLQIDPLAKENHDPLAAEAKTADELHKDDDKGSSVVIATSDEQIN